MVITKMKGEAPTKEAVSNPNILQNPTYSAYVSQRELGTNINQPKMPKQPLDNQRKTIFFSYYDSTVRNSHLNPNLSTTFVKYYDPYSVKPATSTLLRGIERKASQFKNTLKPYYE